MASDDIVSAKTSNRPGCFGRLASRFKRSEDGTAAIEFAILSLPFFILVFATIETFVAFAGEQLLENAVENTGRKIRTGQITFGMGRSSTDMTASQFRSEFCSEIEIMLSCPEGEGKIFLDVRKFDSFADVPRGIPRQGGSQFGDLDTTDFDYNPGGPGEITVVRAYYQWETVTDLVRPYITNVRPEGDSPEYYLMVSTAAFRNEAYP